MNLFRILLVLASFALCGAAEAAIIVVNTTADEHEIDGDCSLREAIAGANTDTKVDACTKGSGADLIWIAVTGTIQTPTLVDLPTITDRVEILGNENLTIDGRGIAPIFTVDLAHPAHDFKLTGNGMILRRGRAVGHGGGALYLVNADQVTVSGVIFEQNRACDVVSSGQCLGSNFREGSGGAIGFHAPSSGAIAHLVLQDSWFLHNSATGNGGGIGTEGETTITIERCSLIGNEATWNGGGAALRSGPLTIRQTLVAGNRAGNGGGIEIFSANGDPPLSVGNTLVIDNEATSIENGTGGVDIFGRTADIAFTTIARNRSAEPEQTAGLRLWETSASFTHTAVTDNFPGADCAYVGQEPNSLQRNIDSDGSCSFDSPTDLVGSSMMSGLGSFMGQPIIALPSLHSPLVDGGNADCTDIHGNTVSVDLLGNPRPVDGDEYSTVRCDIGAIEVQPPYHFLFGDGFEAGTAAAWK